MPEQILLDKATLDGYVDFELEERHRIANKWIDPSTGNLLDAGCSYGYATRFYSKKAKKTWGIEIDPLHIAVAKAKKYGNIEFIVSSVDKTPFENDFFDTIIMTDVLEHLPDRMAALNEMYRILRPGGSIIITTPHKGLFTLLDPYNYGYYLKTYLSPLYRFLFKIVRFVKEGKFPKESNPIHSEKHNHFTLQNYRTMLSGSNFQENYTIEKVLRSGLFIEVFFLNIEMFLKIFIKSNPFIRRVTQPLAWLADKDYDIPYGPLAYNIGLKIRKRNK